MKCQDPDAELLALAGRGDAGAFRQLVSRKLPRIHALAARMLSDPAQADDVAQDAFLRVWRQAPNWTPGQAKFDTWLHRVVLNLYTDRLRRRRELPMADPPEQLDPAPAADIALQRDETIRRVRTAIAKLPTRQGEAIMLQTYQDLSNIDTAAIMGISVEALESLLARGRRTLRDLLRDDAS